MLGQTTSYKVCFPSVCSPSSIRANAAYVRFFRRNLHWKLFGRALLAQQILYFLAHNFTLISLSLCLSLRTDYPAETCLPYTQQRPKARCWWLCWCYCRCCCFSGMVPFCPIAKRLCVSPIVRCVFAGQPQTGNNVHFSQGSV